MGYDTVFVTGGPHAVVGLDRGNGRVRWTTDRFDSHGLPALVDDRLFVTTEEGLDAYDAVTGERRWRREAVGIDAPSVRDGRVVVGTEGAVHAFGLDGRRAWTRQVDGPVRGTPALAGEAVVAATMEGTIYALARDDGSVHWRTDVGGAVTAPVALAASHVYVPTRREDVVALSLADGSERWRAWMRAPVISLPAVTDGNLVVQDVRATAIRLRTLEGGLSFPDVGEWTHTLGDPANTNRAPAATLPTDPSVACRIPFARRNGRALVSRGRLFLGGRDGAYGLSAASGRLNWRYALPDANVTARIAAVGPRGLYAGVGESLWAFEPVPPIRGPDAGGPRSRPATSSWTLRSSTGQSTWPGPTPASWPSSTSGRAKSSGPCPAASSSPTRRRSTGITCTPGRP